MRVVYLQRRAGNGVYSLEGYFEIVRQYLPERVKACVAIAPRMSQGFWPRVVNVFWARALQGDVKHITGDIHYVSYLLRKQQTLLTILDCGFTERTSLIRRAALRLLWLHIPEKRVAAITTISEFTRQQVIGNTGCNPDKVHVIQACISPLFLHVPRKLNTECPTILQVGTTPNKNLERLGEALKGINCQLHIVGALSASQKAALKGINYTNSMDLSPGEIINAYVMADLVAFVSTYEGFGLPIIEANAVGRPVVTSRVTAMPEIAADAACIVDPLDVSSIRNGILKVLQNEEYRNTLIENGLRNKERFSPQAIASQYVALYDCLFKGDAAGRAGAPDQEA